MSNAFSKLHRGIQEAVWKQGWGELRPLQVEAIHAVFESHDHLILSAATASGKTEAAFLPILSRIAASPAASIQALYISPLKALINDQFRRLQDLCSVVDIPVFRWHGDVSSTEKKRLRDSPGGVLLITPESLESQFINYGAQLRAIYSHLDFVVIDELHSFLNSVRGIHLRSLLARLRILTGVETRRIGLSATIGDYSAARSFLDQTSPDSVRLLQPSAEGKELRVGVQAHVTVSENDDSGLDGLTAVANDIAHRFRAGSNLVFCNSRRDCELLCDRLHRIAEKEAWPHDPFRLHHGSLSRDLREGVEGELKSGLPFTAICTSTLEMGIDIGSVRAIGQVGPPWTVSSLVQRIGRSGRRDNEPQILRLYSLDDQVVTTAPLGRRLFPELIRSIALIELHLEKWLEPIEASRPHYSTCVHQVLSVLRQTGGASAATLLDLMCRRGAFSGIDTASFGTLLRGLAAKGLIEQIPTGELILAPAGERIVEDYHFYAAFAAQIEYRVVHNGLSLGVLPRESIPPAGDFLIFAGQRWKVQSVDHDRKQLSVEPARGWKQPAFFGGGGSMHPSVAARMKQILAETSCFAYLDAAGTEFLSQARSAFSEAGLAHRDIIVSADGHVIEWFPWAGSRVIETLELCAKAAGLRAEKFPFWLRYQGVQDRDFRAHVDAIAQGSFQATDVAQLVVDLENDKFDEYVPESLLRAAYVNERIDVDGARQAAARVCAGRG